MKERKGLIFGFILYIIWAIMGAWLLYDEITNPYIPEHGFILILGVLPFALPVIIIVGMALEDV